MQKQNLLLRAMAAVVVASAFALAGCTTTPGTPDTASTNMSKRHAIDADVNATLSRLYSKVQGSRELIAKAHGVSVARVALAWVRSKPFVTSTIIGAKTLEQLNDNLEAVTLALTPDEIKALREKNHVSQPVFARYLNTSQSTVQKWETGAKRPSGPALKLLSLVQKHGLQMLT